MNNSTNYAQGDRAKYVPISKDELLEVAKNNINMISHNDLLISLGHVHIRGLLQQLVDRVEEVTSDIEDIVKFIEIYRDEY